MTTIHAQVPDYLAKLAEEAAVKEQTSLDQIVTLALSAQLRAWQVREDIGVRVGRGRLEVLREILADVPDVPPLPGGGPHVDAFEKEFGQILQEGTELTEIGREEAQRAQESAFGRTCRAAYWVNCAHRESNTDC